MCLGLLPTGLALYRRCDWDKAAAKFNECLKAKPDDTHRQRRSLPESNVLKTEPPGKDWGRRLAFPREMNITLMLFSGRCFRCIDSPEKGLASNNGCSFLAKLGSLVVYNHSAV